MLKFKSTQSYYMLKGFGHCNVCKRHTPPLPSTASPSRMSTAAPRHSGQSWTGCSTISPWSTLSLCWVEGWNVICRLAVTTAGWKIDIPAYWSNNAGVSCTADGIVSSYPRKEKQSVPDGKRPISLVIYGSFRVRSQDTPCFCFEPSPAF